MKYAEDIVSIMNDRGSIKVPEDCTTGEEFDKWMHRANQGGRRMTVKELISKLIDMPMNAEVRLVGVAPHIDEDGDICKGYYFHIDDVKQWPNGVEIEFKDYLRSNNESEE